MAREIVLQFRTRAYERAQEVAQRVAERARRTLDTAKGLRDELKQGLERAQKAAELRQRGSALGERGAAASARDLTSLQQGQFGRLFGSVGAAREKGEALAQVFFGDGSASHTIPALIGGVGQLVPGLGPFAALLRPLTEKLLSFLDERLEQELKKQEARFLARLEEERFRSDYTRRFEEDPAFARAEAKRAFAETLAEEAKLGKRIERNAALIADFGL